MEDKYYTVDQISSMLNIHPKTIQRYIREGKLRASKVGKGWRVTGHDLSVFIEGTSGTSEKVSPKHPGEKEQHTNKQLTDDINDRIKISAVIDIDVDDVDESIRIANMLTAVLNAKPQELGKHTVNTQYIRLESKMRIMLWGGIKFMENIISSISALTNKE